MKDQAIKTFQLRAKYIFYLFLKIKVNNRKHKLYLSKMKILEFLLFSNYHLIRIKSELNNSIKESKILVNDFLIPSSTELNNS
jgi:hypothetical protein